ncbi:thioesterase family protein [Nocardioides carbamazepini]|uniref:acyl-CoA thioesterase n=1 Tax=Nocardioides carbamazepini TaxID=2854259 RepID=UPI00214A8854|nr:thioesterase family protein [Nocardioides carbamazepini]MCR1781071.1 thioesterase family protein [Nocardioides carbamazepini]
MGDVFDCEIQARMRDINLGGHVDNVEALRVLDEARLLFFRHAVLTADNERRGLLRDLPSGVAELVGAQRVDYHSEMRFVAFQPFLVRIWVSHVGRSSCAVSLELRVAPDHAPAVVAETSTVFWDTAAGSAWPVSDAVRAALESYAGPPVALRDRPGR